MLKGYNTSGGLTSVDSNTANKAVSNINNQDLSGQTMQAELSQTHGAMPNFNMIEGLQINGKRQPNF